MSADDLNDLEQQIVQINVRQRSAEPLETKAAGKKHFDTTTVSDLEEFIYVGLLLEPGIDYIYPFLESYNS